MQKTCILCGKQFETASSRRKICYEKHYHKCPVCGKSVLTTDLQHTGSCCCKEHSRILAAKHNSETYNSKSDEEKQAIKDNQKKAFLDTYGVDNPSKCPEVVSKIQDSYSKFKNSNRYSQMIENRKQTNLEKYGTEIPMQSDVVKSKMKATLHSKYGDNVNSTFQVDEFKKKADETNLEKYGSTIPMKNHDIWSKQTSQRSKTVASDGLKLDSEYEKIFYEFCLRNNLNVRRSIPIDYEYEGEQHRTFIDFEVDGMLFECKGEHILDGYFDYRGVPISAKLEVYRKHHVIVITGDSKKDIFKNYNGLKYEDYPLIGVDLNLFKQNTEFPYKEDRPKCFYDVKVNGQKSVHDAFYDEIIRWRMIVNRINYTGGFIDNNQIITALNVTRICKQPSWFSKSFAKKIIQTYCTSATIVDPFAGWGARCDAAKDLKRNYIGCDANEELVNWHHENGRNNIVFGDAKNFKYDEKCSVFICPPYQDVEIYFDGQDNSLTQCDWLKICMKNIPNATEYVMVCKIIDPGWEKYIVETKINRSHFGKNNEYVLVIYNDDKDSMLKL